MTSSTPMPTPAMNRQTSIQVAVVWKAMIADEAAYQSSDTVKMVRRPNRSATNPNSMVPTNSPANRAATKAAMPDPNRPGVVVRMCSRTRPGAT